MSHEVESMFYVGEVPWHRLGVKVAGAPNSEEAIRVAGIDWTVSQADILVGNRPVPDYKANVRSSDGAVLGLVGSRYRVVQNRDAFRFTDELLGQGVRYETAGSLYNGKRIWMLARLPKNFRLLGDEVDAYVCFTNSHDGEGSVRVVVTPVRVVCQNTLNLALKQARYSWATPHIGSVFGRLEAARSTLGLADEYFEALRQASEEMARARLIDERWEQLMRHLFPVRPEGGEQHKEGVALRRRMVRELHDRPDLADYRGTAWAAVNALVDYADHVYTRPVTPATQETHFSNVLSGRELVTKGMAWLTDQLDLSLR